MRKIRFAILTIIIMVGVSVNLLSYTRSQKSIKEKKHWSISFYLATTSPGPASDIEKAMIDSGFDKTSYGWLFSSGPIKHPFSRTGFGELGAPWAVELHYLFMSPFSLGIVVSNAPLGFTYGYHENYRYLKLDYSVQTYGAIFSFDFEWIRFGIGPAYHIAEVSQKVRLTEEINRKGKFGLLFDIALMSSRRTRRFFVEFKAQYRLVGKTEIGPFEVTLTNAIFPATEVRFNYWFIGLGVGIRL